VSSVSTDPRLTRARIVGLCAAAVLAGLRALSRLITLWLPRLTA
jgi:hypothetical protein